MNRFSPTTRTLSALAIAGCATFVLLVVALNIMQRHAYDPGVQAISELALGRGGSLMVVAFSGLGVGIALLAVIVRRTCEKSVATPLLLAVAAVLAGPISAAFHTDAHGAKTTLEGNIHNLSGLSAFLLILVAMFTAAYRFKRSDGWRRLSRPTLAWAGVAVVTFFLVPALGDAHFGLGQRMFVGTFISWLLVAAAHARLTFATPERLVAPEVEAAVV